VLQDGVYMFIIVFNNYQYLIKYFFTMRLVKHWNMLPREAVDASSLEVFKARLEGALRNLV